MAKKKIGIVGGIERAKPHFDRAAALAGHEVYFHDGRLAGTGRAALARLIARCDVVVVVTDVNSHAAVQVTRRLMREQGRAPVITRRFGLAQFATFAQNTRAA